MQNFVLLMGSDHEITSAELASHFGATEGRSVMPEQGNATTFDSGAVFYPSVVDPLWVGTIVLGAFLCALLFAAFPAWRAASLDPLQALRYE